MSSTDGKEDDKIEPETAEATPPRTRSSSRKRNAFSELMSPKPKQPPRHRKRKAPTSPPASISSTSPTQPPAWSFNLSDRRNGLLPYLTSPETNPNNLVVSHTDSFTLIRDAYPKATVHLLLLPRDMGKTTLNPRTALSRDPTFLASVRAAAAEAKVLAAKELGRLVGKHSATEQARTQAMETADPDTALPAGRDYAAAIRVGVHAHPSMAHLHIHLLSGDMHSACLRHRKHYNSFNTPFFVPLDAFPLAADDERWSTAAQNANLDAEFACWRCGRGFGRSFARFKRHLDEEFEAWVKE